MKIISLVNQKGGVAKTTTAMALADYFARQGKKTLLIDFDPQGSLTTAFRQADDQDNPLALKLLELEKTGNTVSPIELSKNLSVVTSDIGLEKANLALPSKVGKERYLRRAIDKLNDRNHYDYVILDSNPSFSQLTINVLYASDEVLIPFKPEYNSFKGIVQLLNNIEEIKEIQPNLNVLGFVITMARPVKSAQQSIDIIRELAERQKCRVFAPPIRLAVAAADAPSHGSTVHAYAPNSDVAKDYDEFAKAILDELEGF